MSCNAQSANTECREPAKQSEAEHGKVGSRADRSDAGYLQPGLDANVMDED